MPVGSMIIIEGPQTGQSFELPVGIVSIGRDQTNSVQVSDPEISRRHAELHFQERGCVIIDLGSANGVFVNGERVSSKMISVGDVVKLGMTSFTFSDETPLFSSTDGASQPLKWPKGSIAESRGPSSAKVRDADETTANWIAQAKSNLQLMCETALATSHHTEVDRLVERLLDLVVSWIDADRACVLLKDDGGEEWSVKASRQKLHSEPFSIPPSVIEWVVNNEEGVFSENQRHDGRFDIKSDPSDIEERSVICVPIRGRDSISGMIYVDTLVGSNESVDGVEGPLFHPDQMKMLLAIGHQAAVAIENTGYYSLLLDRERNTAVGHVMESLSHYIRNILQSINGGTHLIECGLKGAEYELVEKGWQIVQRNQDCLSGLVMDMLAHSKPREPKPKQGDLKQLIEKVVESLGRRAEFRDVVILHRMGDVDAKMLFDFPLLERAVHNLLLAAINTCRDNEPGVVRISLDARDGALLLTIENNGSELSQAEVDEIFDPLAVNEKANLMGIGLAVSQRSIIEHGGTVDARKTEGSEIRFEMVLPRGL